MKSFDQLREGDKIYNVIFDYNTYESTVSELVITGIKLQTNEKRIYHNSPCDLEEYDVEVMIVHFKLNNDFDCSELELKLYLLCCSYRDLCCYENKSVKILTFESVKDAFNIKKNSSDVNKTIRKALLFLKSIGLIEYTEQLINNSRGAAIPCFRLHEVNYYINYEIEQINEEIEDQDLKEILLRVNEIISSTE